MWRESAIRSFLLEEICGLQQIDQSSAEDPTESDSDRQLRKARQRAGLVVTLDWLAVIVLFALRSADRPWLPVGASEESIFTLGILVLAVHSGFRLGQLEKLRAVSRLLEDLRERAGG